MDKNQSSQNSSLTLSSEATTPKEGADSSCNIEIDKKEMQDLTTQENNTKNTV